MDYTLNEVLQWTITVAPHLKCSPNASKCYFIIKYGSIGMTPAISGQFLHFENIFSVLTRPTEFKLAHSIGTIPNCEYLLDSFVEAVVMTTQLPSYYRKLVQVILHCFLLLIMTSILKNLLIWFRNDIKKSRNKGMGFLNAGFYFQDWL